MRHATVPLMLSDRSYMREDYLREKTSALTWLISAMIAGFLLQLAMRWLDRRGARLEELFAVSAGALQNGWGWTLLTHAFLHSSRFIVHGVFNLLALYFLGRELLPILGARRFLGLFAAATIVGGLAWSGTHWSDGSATLIGATAAVQALFVVFACFFPNQPLSFLLFFVIPVTLKPKHVAYGLATIAGLGFVCYELPGNTLPFDVTIASSAHLGGLLTGFFYYRFVHDGRWLTSQDSAEVELPRWLKRTRRPALRAAAPVLELAPPAAAANPEDIRARVDRILDKINSEGLASLTAEEKRILDNARDLLTRR